MHVLFYSANRLQIKKSIVFHLYGVVIHKRNCWIFYKEWITTILLVWMQIRWLITKCLGRAHVEIFSGICITIYNTRVHASCSSSRTTLHIFEFCLDSSSQCFHFQPPWLNELSIWMGCSFSGAFKTLLLMDAKKLKLRIEYCFEQSNSIDGMTFNDT